MTRLTKTIAACLLGGILLVSALRASPLPPLDLKKLATHADVIAVGQVSQLRQDGPTKLRVFGEVLQGHVFLGRLDVQRVLKGQVPPGALTFNYSLPEAPVGYRGIGPGIFGVFFFRRDQSGLEILNPYYPYVVAAPGLGPTAGSIEDQIIAEIAHILSSPTSTSDMRLDAVLAFQTVSTPAAGAALKEAAEGTDVRARVIALDTLLERGDISVLPAIEQIAVASKEANDDDLMMGIGIALRSVRDPRAIPTLKILMRAPNVYVRRGAVAALRNMHAPVVLPALTNALYDPDREVRYYAVVGLGEITGQNEWTPAIANFNQNEKRFLDHWRAWAKRHQPARAPKTAKPSH